MCTFEDMRAGHSGDPQLPSLGIYGEIFQADSSAWDRGTDVNNFRLFSLPLQSGYL